MQKECVSIQSKLFPIRQTKESQGVVVPWEVRGYLEDFETARKQGGVFDLSHWSVIEILGEDASDFLHRMSTCDLKKFDAGKIHHAAFLTGKAHTVTLGLLQAVDKGFHYILPPSQGQIAWEHIEKFHFAERFTTVDKSEEWSLFGLWNPAARLATSLGLSASSEPLRIHSVIWEGIPLETWKDDSRELLFWVKMKRKDDPPSFLSHLNARKVELLGQRLFEYFRIKSAVPQVGLELSEKDIVLEGNFDRAVARNKGCYPGQEVVERIFTYGQVNRKLFPVEIKGGNGFPPVPFVLADGEKQAGQVVACIESPEDRHCAVGLAYLHKQFWETGQSFSPVPGISVRRRG